MLTPDQFQIVEAVYQARQRMARQTYKLFAIWIPLLLIVGMVIEYNQSGKVSVSFCRSAADCGAGGGFLAIL
jgi:hypothetical protein